MSEIVEEKVMVTASDIIPCFTIQSQSIRQAAFEEACKMAPDNQICGSLLSVFQNGRETQQTWFTVLKALSLHGKGNSGVQEVLRDRLEQSNEYLQISVAEAFFLTGGEVNLALETIAPFLKATDRLVKRHAIFAIVSFGNNSLPLAVAIVEIAIDEKEFEGTRVEALRALQAIGTEAKVVSPQIAKNLSTRSAKVLAELLETLEKIGVVKEAIPDLIAALNYRDPQTHHVRNRHPGLMFMDGADMHQTVAKLLGSLGKDANEALPVLEEILRRETDLEEYKRRLDEEAETFNAPRIAKAEAEGKRPFRLYLKKGSRGLSDEDVRLTSLEAKKAALEAIGSIKYGLTQA